MRIKKRLAAALSVPVLVLSGCGADREEVIDLYVLAVGANGLIILGAPTWVSHVFSGVAFLIAVSAATLVQRRKKVVKLATNSYGPAAGDSAVVQTGDGDGPDGENRRLHPVSWPASSMPSTWSRVEIFA